MTGRIAAIDLGSNTLRLLIADDQSMGRKDVFQDVPRLSEGLPPGGRFNKTALARVWAALDGFAAEIEKAKVQKVFLGATMAARLAADGPDLMAAINAKYGWHAAILSSEEEAVYTAQGVLWGLDDKPAQAVIFDIGGRSTEFALLNQGRIGQTTSLSLGVVEMTERHIAQDPPLPNELTGLIADAGHRLLSDPIIADFPKKIAMIGTAGTVTTIAAMLLKLPKYLPEFINGAIIHKSQILDLSQTLAAQTTAERAAIQGLPPRRADVIVAGLLIVLEIMSFFDVDAIRVSDNSLLEGLWLKASGMIA